MKTMNEGLDEVKSRQVVPHTFVMFGATGDLAKRKLYPALFNLHKAGLLNDTYTIIGVGRTQFDDSAFQAEIRKMLDDFSRLPVESDEEWEDFRKHLRYCKVDADKPEEFVKLNELVNEIEGKLQAPHNRLFYLAMAPGYFGKIALSLQSSGLSETSGWRRLIIEKPFGRDYASAEELNTELTQVFEEEEIYRIDHYLGKEMVQNIEVIRFANSIFEPVWNNKSIDNIQITSSETVGVEERASYYDKAGALRDMVQNHMLQMVMMIAMEPPSRLKTEAIRDEKVKVLRSLRRYSVEEVGDHVVRGQYGQGVMKDADVPAYLNEPNVPPTSTTETFIAAQLFVDNFRWSGVPFYIRTGKRMKTKSTEIVIQFKDMPKHLYFNQDGNLGANLLVIRVNPVEGMYIQLNAKRPGTDGTVIPVAMEFSQATDNSPEAYERLLHDAMLGDSTFFTRWDEVSLAWKFVDPIAESFGSKEDMPLHVYDSGSWGPQASEELVEKDGKRWWPVYGQETKWVENELERVYSQAQEVPQR